MTVTGCNKRPGDEQPGDERSAAATAEAGLDAANRPAAGTPPERASTAAAPMSRRSLTALRGASQAFERGDIDGAEALLRTLEGVGGEAEARAAAFLGDVRLREGRLQEAEQQLRRALAAWPQMIEAHMRLALLYGYAGQGWRAVPHAEFAASRGVYKPPTLVLLAQPDAVLPAPSEFAAIPDDRAGPMLLLGRVQLARSERRTGDAQRLLERAIAAGLDPVEAAVEASLVSLAAGRPFADHLVDAPAAAALHPGFWRLCGLAAEAGGRRNVASRCFAESLRLLPDDTHTLLGLSRTLPRESPEAAAAGERARQVQQMQRDLRVLSKTPDAVVAYAAVIGELTTLGRPVEAAAWLELAARKGADATHVREAMNGLAPLIAARVGRIAANAVSEFVTRQPPADASLAQAALGGGSEAVAETDAPATPGEGTIRFRDDGAASGLVFQYVSRADAGETGRRMHEFTGGGVGVIDVNGDLWPDAYFAQATAGARPMPAADATLSDRLFLNQQGRRWIDVTSQAGVFAPDFGQGVAAGDANGDGFADLYVGQIGRNRLWLSNGDGTFHDASAVLPESGWTTSVAIADIDGDTRADLYDVNYLRGEGVFERVCEMSDGTKMACSPVSFPPAADALMLGDGRGGFRSAGREDGFDNPAGNGLGLVVGRFDTAPRDRPSLDLFIANDMTANLFISGPTGRDRSFTEEGVLRGVAFNDRAVAEAGMGIAAGDPDADGDIDLLVTNFYEETNTLYEQRPGGGFVDATAARSLERPGYELLGFGTQFLDADGDGAVDLLIANGHVDDQPNVPFAMPPTVLRNAGGRFAVVSPTQAGPYFAGEYLGRGLARLDWNSDGRPDAVVTHLDAPAALLTNLSDGPPSMDVRLVATTTHRDAIGAVATATIETADSSASATRHTQRQFQMAGDGYLTSNQRILSFATGPGGRVVSIEVRWPGGAVETFPGGAAGAVHTLVEGAGVPADASAPDDRSAARDGRAGG